MKNGPASHGHVGENEIYNKNQGSSILPQVAKLGLSEVNDVNKVGKIQNAIGFAKRPLNLTPKKMKEKRLKNQCFWCEEKFVPGHRCKNQQLHLIRVQNDIKGEEKPGSLFSFEDKGS